MTNKTTTTGSGKRIAGICLIAGALTLMAGCQTYDAALGSGTSVTATDSARLTRSGFLSDYARLKPNPQAGGIECWRDPRLDAARFDKVMVSRIVVSLAAPKGERGRTEDDRSERSQDADRLFPWFAGQGLETADAGGEQGGAGGRGDPHCPDRSGADHRYRQPGGNAHSLAFVAEAGSGVATGRPAGSTPYMGETGMEMQFRDGANGQIIAECRDTQIGRKYAADVDGSAVGAAQTWASGYMNSFQAWSYAKNAFDKWSLLVAQRFAELRGVTPPVK